MHLPELIDSIHAVHSHRLAPYLAHNRMEICSRCALLHSSICPCPMDYLALLVVEAVEAMDERRGRREKGLQFLASLPETNKAGITEICQAYKQGAGTWVGCDWSTRFGTTQLDLNGWTHTEAEARAVEAIGTDLAGDWSAAASWLARVEEYARQAETDAAAAVNAAAVGHWELAVQHAHRAWAREFSTGRPFRKGETTWKGLRLAIESAWLACQKVLAAGEPEGDETGQRAP
jgi:hypothetical protein